MPDDGRMSIVHAKRGKGRDMRIGDYVASTRIDPAPRKGLPGGASRLRSIQPCLDCGQQMPRGSVAFWVEAHHGWRHPTCWGPLQPGFVPGSTSPATVRAS